MLYIELFLGFEGAFTRISTRFNTHHHAARVQRAIDQWDPTTPVLPSTARHIDKFKVLIGIGAIKCGTTFFQYALRRRCHQMEMNNNQSIHHYIFRIRESHFFEECTDCSFKEYIAHFNDDGNVMDDPLASRDSSNRIWIFSEKTVTYFDDYNVAHLLSFYGHRYDLYFYVVLRNPVKQLWSHLWMRTEGCNPRDGLRIQCLLIRNENYRLNRTKMEDIDRMEEYITEYLEDDRIHNELPIFWEIMQRLKID